MGTAVQQAERNLQFFEMRLALDVEGRDGHTTM